MFKKKSMSMCCDLNYMKGYNNAIDDAKDILREAAELIRADKAAEAEILLRRACIDA